MAPNKTLAAQLYAEFKGLFPNNAVEYFVSYYDYYQPEAYIPSTDTYIEKDSHINDEIDKLRHSTTHALLTRRDVLVVASVSSIYGLGAPETYGEMHAYLEVGRPLVRDDLLRRLVDMLYERNDLDFHRGTFRVRGDVVEVFPPYEARARAAHRVLRRRDRVDRRDRPAARHGDRAPAQGDDLPGQPLRRDRGRSCAAPSSGIREELQERLAGFRGQGKLLEAQRLEQRTLYDLEMLEEMGFCHGVENYSRWLDGRSAGQTPYTLFDYFPRGPPGRARREPHQRCRRSAACSAATARARRRWSSTACACRPRSTTGRCASTSGRRARRSASTSRRRPPSTSSRSARAWWSSRSSGRRAWSTRRSRCGRRRGRSTTCSARSARASQQGERVLVTTLTKRMAEELTDYYAELGVRVRYLHSDVETIERMDIIRELREGEFDVLVGINLLREGLDIPEVSLVAILDADKEGFLRSTRSLIQTIGRAARNVNGTRDPLRRPGDRLDPRDAGGDQPPARAAGALQRGARHHADARIVKRITSIRDSIWEQDYVTVPLRREREDEIPEHELPALLEGLRREMREAAKALDFERAAELRDRIAALESERLRLGLGRMSLAERAEGLPARPGVYLFKSERGKVLYVGKAQNLRQRVRQYVLGGDGRVRMPPLLERARRRGRGGDAAA